MSIEKKAIRNKFRAEVFERDDYRCRKCPKPAADAHHIIDRSLMENGGYILSNGISLCSECHILAEKGHKGYTVEDLTKIIQGDTKHVYVLGAK